MSESYDPATYHAVSRPFGSEEEAHDALTAFSRDLEALREKHRIRDVLYVLQVDAIGGEYPPTVAGYRGNSAVAAVLAEVAYVQFARRSAK